MDWNSEILTLSISGTALIIACIALYFSAALQRLQRRELRDELNPIRLTQTETLDIGVAWGLMNDSPRTLRRVRLIGERGPEYMGSWPPGHRIIVGVADTRAGKVQTRLSVTFWMGAFRRKQVVRFHWISPSGESSPMSIL